MLHGVSPELQSIGLGAWLLPFDHYCILVGGSRDDIPNSPAGVGSHHRGELASWAQTHPCHISHLDGWESLLTRVGSHLKLVAVQGREAGDCYRLCALK